jgi:exodeoxyribonuclease VII small subunit
MDKQSSYARTRERLEEIVTQVKAKDMPLEKSLDLYEEALRLGSACAEMIDRTDFSTEELESIDVLADEDADEDIADELVEEIAPEEDESTGELPDGDDGDGDAYGTDGDGDAYDVDDFEGDN